jgi:dUTP pyrophosphatase
MFEEAKKLFEIEDDEFVTMPMMADFTKRTGIKPTLVSTGMKCHLDPDTFLQLSVRSSSPLKYWIMMANGVGIIDADYCNNPDNEGEIFFQLFNLSPFNIQIKKGEAIGQGIILPYGVTDDDNASGERLGGFGSTSK